MISLTAKQIAQALGDDEPEPNGRNGVVTYCPVHGETKGSKRSLSISANGGKLLVKCFAGCEQNEVFRAVRQVAGEDDERPDQEKRKSRHKRLIEEGYKVTAEYAYRRADGSIYYWVLRYEHPTLPKEIGPRHLKPSGRYSYTMPGDKRRILYQLDQLVKRPDEIVHATEGEKDADTLAQLGLLATSFKLHHRTDLSPLKGRHVVVHRDRDPINPLTGTRSGEAQADAFARDVKGIVASLKLAADYLIEGRDKTDVTDWLAAGHTEEELRVRIAEAVDYEPPPAPEGEDTIDGVNITGKQLDSLTVEAWDVIERANVERPRLFNFGGDLVRVHDSTVAELAVPDVRYELAALTTWHRWDARKEEFTAAYPPKDLCENVLATPDHAMRAPTLRRVSRLPLITPAGRILATPGFDAETGVWVNVAGLDGISVPETPTREEAAAGLAFITEELLHDFPFVSTADRTNCLALLLTMLARQLIDGPTPLFLLDKPEIGTGASLIVETFGLVAFGDNIAASTMPTGDEEVRKRITSLLRASANLIWLDNVDSVLASSSLAAVLTARVWEDRQLGVNRIIRAPNEATWVVTGNQPTTSKDIARRTVDVRLDAQMERPFERKAEQFRHPNLKAWAREHRPKLVAASLTVIKAWLVAGQPSGKHHIMGSFEEWSRVLGGILAHAGAAGFLENRDTFFERAVPMADAEKQLIEAWWAEFQEREVFTSQVLDLIDGKSLETDSINIKLKAVGDSNRQNELQQLLKHKFRDKRYTILDDRNDGEAHLDVSVVVAGKARRRAQWRLAVHRRAEVRPQFGFEEACAATERAHEAEVTG